LLLAPTPSDFQMNAPKQKRPASGKVHPIFESADPVTTGMPVNLDAERFVLGAVLLDDARFDEISGLELEDFSLDRHQSVFRRMRDLHARGEHIDRVTVAEELRRHNELGTDGITFLMSLDEGIPRVPHLDSYVRILRKKTALRRGVLVSQKFMNECLLEGADVAEILAGYTAQLEELSAAAAPGQTKIRRVEELESIFAKRMPTEYLIRPELPIKAIVCLTGDSESGKTTLACAWARDVHRQGHAVLILDRDKNPRDRICERLERLGVKSDGEQFRVWDCEQLDEPAQPDDPIISDWVKSMVATTGKSPLVIVDSLVSFFIGDEDENSAIDMRRLFNRCRELTKLGATMIIIHHTNRNGEARGSSDFRPASDQAFLVSNQDRDGGRLLDEITLRCEKSRYGLSGRIEYRYAGGEMRRVETEVAPSKSVTERLRDLLIANSGILKQPFEDLANQHGLGRNRARDFLKQGEEGGTIRVRREGRKRHHFWRGAEVQADDLDLQQPLA
jgi:archaellum biogenesis ATPase FlaH